jgi:nicotinamide-nucleotide amidase
LQTTGIGESNLQAEIGDLSDVLDNRLRLAYLPSTSGVRLRLTAYDPDRDRAEERLDALETELRRRAGRYIFGTGDDTLEGVLGEVLRDRLLTLGTAESATGGLVGSRVTDVPGSSDYFLGGAVTYAYSAKEDLLGVSHETLVEKGAVCEEVALQMARGIRRAVGSNIGVSTTGIAGPTGGSDEKPVGTVWIGYSFVPDPDEEDDEISYARRLQFVEDRQLNKELFATSALEMVRRQVLRMEATRAEA